MKVIMKEKSNFKNKLINSNNLNNNLLSLLTLENNLTVKLLIDLILN